MIKRSAHSETVDRMDLQWFADDAGTGGSSADGGQSAGDAGSLSGVMTGGDGGTQTEPTKPEPIKLEPWGDQLPDDIKGNPEVAKRFTGFKKIGDLAKSYMELEDKVAKQVTPDKPEGYDVSKEKDSAEFVKLAMESKLTNDQANVLYNKLKSTGELAMQSMQTAQRNQLIQTEAALKIEYGPKYPEKMESLKRGLKVAGEGVSKALRDAGLAGNPDIIRTFITFGEMTSESGGAQGSHAHGVKSLMDGGSFTYKE